jgi:hypothetical protein
MPATRFVPQISQPPRSQSVCVSQKACSTAIRRVKNVRWSSTFGMPKQAQSETVLTVSIMSVANTLLLNQFAYFFAAVKLDHTTF